MKILFLSHNFSPFVGGIEINSEILATEFVKSGHEVCLLTWTASEEERPFPFKVVRDPDTADLFKLHRWAEVVFENNPCLRLSWPNLLIGRPLVVALRTWISRIGGAIGVQDRIKTQWLKHAAEVIAVSESVRQRSWKDAKVIGNPYRHDAFNIDGTVNRDKDFVFLGRLVSDKGADLAIRALKAVSDRTEEGRKPTLTIIGDGEERNSLEKLTSELGIGDQVVFTGILRNGSLVQCLNRHKYILIPSVWEEPFGNVALEGMACGCIPIASDGGGLPDAVGKAGITFRRGKVESLVKAILSIMENPSREEELRKAAPEHLRNHTPEVVASRYLEVLTRAVQKSK